MRDYATKFIGQQIKVTIDRPLGSKHPDYGTFYPVNYGFIKGEKAPDGEELDAYVLGVDHPLKDFSGRCIAVIQRIDDDDDKLVVVPEGMEIGDDEILKQVNFQEKYFKSEIVR
ncbi:inorganic diphosphatase [Patescibacteria group bacterium]|nr:inorganic diphosphatase [Patescibacteria group bacterium]